MQFEDILNEKRITMYRLAKESGIPHTTIRDICGGKAKIKNCTVDTVYRISKVLNISIEKLYEYESEQEKESLVPYRDTFEIFKSNTCHTLKTLGDIAAFMDGKKLSKEDADRIRRMIENFEE